MSNNRSFDLFAFEGTKGEMFLRYLANPLKRSERVPICFGDILPDGTCYGFIGDGENAVTLTLHILVEKDKKIAQGGILIESIAGKKNLCVKTRYGVIRVGSQMPEEFLHHNVMNVAALIIQNKIDVYPGPEKVEALTTELRKRRYTRSHYRCIPSIS